MRHQLGLGVVQALALGALPGYFQQGFAQPIGQAGELHRMRIGQKFALARHGGFQQPPGQPAYAARAHQGPAQQGECAVLPVFIALCQGLAQRVNHLQTEHHADEAHVEPGVAALDVAKLVRHHALQLVAGEALQGSVGDGDGTVFSRPARGEGVDGFFAVQHKHPGHGQAAGDGHFMHHVAQAALGQVAWRGDFAPAQHVGHMGTALAQLEAFHPPAAQHKKQRHGRVGLEKPARGAQHVHHQQPPRQPQCGIHARHCQRNGEHKHCYQAAGGAVGLGLVFTKAHGLIRTARARPCVLRATRWIRAWRPGQSPAPAPPGWPETGLHGR